jgi:uncharacterized membrane protein YdjX (TVP38/TMEM64 family)
LKRALPLALLLAVAAVLLWTRPDASLSMAKLQAHHVEIQAWVAAHYALAVFAFAAIHFTTKTFLIPSGPFMTFAAGYLLGTTVATATAVLTGCLAAAVLYVVADRAIGRQLRARAIPFVDRVARGFRRYGFSYLVAMRLIPVMPFSVATIAPAILGVPFRTFLAATLVGGFPSQLIYASIGGALGTLADEGASAAEMLRSPRVLAPLFALAVLALAPVLLNHWRGRGAAAAGTR